MTWAWWLAVGVVSFVAAGGCQQQQEELEPFRAPEVKDYGRPLPPGALALRKIPPADYPDFKPGFYEKSGLRQAVENSLHYLAKSSSRRYFPYGAISHARAVASLEAFLAVLEEADSAEQFDQMIRSRFEVYQSVGWDQQGTVYFTGYYTPIFDGRKQRGGEFQDPLYQLPPDLVKDSEGVTLGRRTPDGALVPYFTREEIESQGLLDGLEIAWLSDPFEAYVVTVQGSAKLRLADGSMYELGYAGNNGHDYTSVALAMVEAGVIGRDEVSLQRMIDYFRQHPARVDEFCWKNDRYVFFQERAGGPYGSLNEPVTPFRSIATDKSVFPRACLAFVDADLTRLYDGRLVDLPFRSFVLDQDTGGAIRAAGRCDVYMGIGPKAEAIAGRTGSEGALYYLFLPYGTVAETGSGEDPLTQ